jgi:hypothetical protein
MQFQHFVGILCPVPQLYTESQGQELLISFSCSTKLRKNRILLRITAFLLRLKQHQEIWSLCCCLRLGMIKSILRLSNYASFIYILFTYIFYLTLLK